MTFSLAVHKDERVSLSLPRDEHEIVRGKRWSKHVRACVCERENRNKGEGEREKERLKVYKNVHVIGILSTPQLEQTNVLQNFHHQRHAPQFQGRKLCDP